MAKASPGKGWERVPLAGKTGTAWRTARAGIDDSWMVAWAPAERARVVTCVLVEGAGTGAAVAGPIAVELLKGGLETLRVSP